MTEAQWLALGQYLLAGIGGGLIWSLRKAFWAGSYSTSHEVRMAAIEKRMDNAGEKMSDFATTIQSMPERMRDTYATIDQHEDLKSEVLYLRQKVDRRSPDDPDSPWPNNRRKRP